MRTDWEYYNPNPPRQDYFLERINGLLGASDLFLAMKNTGSATQRRCAADEVINHIPAGVNIRPLRALCPSGSVAVLTQWRHPDPQLQSGWKVIDEELHVRGSWQKIKISGNILPRMGFATFIWKSGLLSSLCSVICTLILSLCFRPPVRVRRNQERRTDSVYRHALYGSQEARDVA